METLEEGVVEGGSATGFTQSNNLRVYKSIPVNLPQNQYGAGVSSRQMHTGGVNFQSRKVYTGRYPDFVSSWLALSTTLKWTVTVSMLKTDGPERFGMRGVVDSLTNTMIKEGHPVWVGLTGKNFASQ